MPLFNSKTEELRALESVREFLEPTSQEWMAVNNAIGLFKQMHTITLQQERKHGTP